MSLGTVAFPPLPPPRDIPALALCPTFGVSGDGTPAWSLRRAARWTAPRGVLDPADPGFGWSFLCVLPSNLLDTSLSLGEKELKMRERGRDRQTGEEELKTDTLRETMHVLPFLKGVPEGCR